MKTRSATWTPPRPLPTIAPAVTKRPIPAAVPGRPSETTPITSPTAQLASTQSSVRLGPKRSTRRPQPKLAVIATTVSSTVTIRYCCSVRPTTRTATTLMTTMIVLTASA